MDTLSSFTVPIEFLLIIIGKLNVLVHDIENFIDFISCYFSGILLQHLLNQFCRLHLFSIPFEFLHACFIRYFFLFIFENRIHYLVKVCMTRMGRLNRHSVDDPVSEFFHIFKINFDLDWNMLVIFRWEQFFPKINDANFLTKNRFGKPVDGFRPVGCIVLGVKIYLLPILVILKCYAFGEVDTHSCFLLENITV